MSSSERVRVVMWVESDRNLAEPPVRVKARAPRRPRAFDSRPRRALSCGAPQPTGGPDALVRAPLRPNAPRSPAPAAVRVPRRAGPGRPRVRGREEKIICNGRGASGGAGRRLAVPLARLALDRA